MAEKYNHRPTKINERLIEKMAKAVESGMFIESVAAYAGISKSTFYDWLRRGERERQRVEANPRRKVRKSEELYVDFSYAIEIAMGRADARDELRLENFANSDWRALVKKMEMKHPERYYQRQAVALEGTEKVLQVQVNLQYPENGDVND